MRYESLTTRNKPKKLLTHRESNAVAEFVFVFGRFHEEIEPEIEDDLFVRRFVILGTFPEALNQGDVSNRRLQVPEERNFRSDPLPLSISSFLNKIHRIPK